MTEPVDWRTICEEQESYPLALIREQIAIADAALTAAGEQL